MKRNTLLLLSFLPFLLLGQSKQKIEKIDGVLKDYHTNGKFQGAALVAENNRVIYQNGFGQANLEQAIPNDIDTKFQIGSITKQFTAMLILQLVEQQKIRLQDSISQYLPDFRKDIGQKVTIHQLLSHTSGIPNYTCQPSFFNLSKHQNYQPSEFINTFCSNKPSFEPGTRFEYSNSGYFILGHLIERITQSNYETALQHYIFQPTDMYNSGYQPKPSDTSNRAIGYRRVENTLHPVGVFNPTIPFAAGALYTTASDLFKWDQALKNHLLLSPQYQKLLFTSNKKSYGYGWMLKNYRQSNGKKTKVAMHGGSIDGFRSLIIRFLDDNKLVVLLNNTDTADLNNLSQKIAKTFYKT